MIEKYFKTTNPPKTKNAGTLDLSQILKDPRKFRKETRQMFRKLKISVQQKSVKKGKSTENILVKNALEGYLLKNAKKAAKPAAQQAFVAARAAYRAAKLAFESARSSTRAPGRFSFANLVRKNGRMNTTTTAVRSKSSTRRRDAFMMKATRVIPKNKKQWRVGDRCQALYRYDGKYYAAYIIRVDKASVYVEYNDYEGEFATLSLSEIKK